MFWSSTCGRQSFRVVKFQRRMGKAGGLHISRTNHHILNWWRLKQQLCTVFVWTSYTPGKAMTPRICLLVLLNFALSRQILVHWLLSVRHMQSVEGELWFGVHKLDVAHAIQRSKCGAEHTTCYRMCMFGTFWVPVLCRCVFSGAFLAVHRWKGGNNGKSCDFQASAVFEIRHVCPFEYLKSIFEKKCLPPTKAISWQKYFMTGDSPEIEGNHADERQPVACSCIWRGAIIRMLLKIQLVTMKFERWALTSLTKCHQPWSKPNQSHTKWCQDSSAIVMYKLYWARNWQRFDTKQFWAYFFVLLLSSCWQRIMCKDSLVDFGFRLVASCVAQ